MEKKDNKKLIIAIIAAVAVIAIVAVVLVLVLGGNKDKKADTSTTKAAVEEKANNSTDSKLKITSTFKDTTGSVASNDETAIKAAIEKYLNAYIIHPSADDIYNSFSPMLVASNEKMVRELANQIVLESKSATSAVSEDNVSYEATVNELVDSSNEDWKEIIDSAKDEGLDASKLQAMADVSVVITAKNAEGEAKDFDLSLTMSKENGTWYILMAE